MSDPPQPSRPPTDPKSRPSPTSKNSTSNSGINTTSKPLPLPSVTERSAGSPAGGPSSSQPQPSSQQPQLPGTKLATSLTTLTTQTRTAHDALTRMMQTTTLLREQAAAHGTECEALEAEKNRAKAELEAMVRRVEGLVGMKGKVEGRLRELRVENGRLDAVLMDWEAGKTPT
ncbi:uncharacterized protein EV422DRAFT_567612 [Fimicolochytrium jonesii]|uniref:uncharacterized protein n=1 Tax=Fimicolochytrium jonesii TaxID=1396493 RepID=UPI0022FEA0BD|nr:uncharacterized protein EV422DRAFT_567612 [Fimicolochytrium jonesii]KAI8820717.1 hypothetical protein EV422DRAFT_567612 [Fimicolochytrium jonesii]